MSVGPVGSGIRCLDGSSLGLRCCLGAPGSRSLCGCFDRPGWVEVITVPRQVQTLLFTDIVGSTDRLQDLGDAAWAALLARHHGVIRRVLAAHGGREVNTAGDGFLARFDAPAPAVRAAAAAVAGVSALEIEIRAGLHTGEVELDEEEIGGVGVHLAARVMAQAAAGQVLVSSTVRELLAGSGLRFVEFGVRQLKGFTESWRLFALDLATVQSDEAERLAWESRGLPAPAQLPHGLSDFTGRVAELDRLQTLSDAAGRDRAAGVVCVVSGTAGVGKTALAVHWAHRVADQFGDGQLYVNLRGFDPGGSVMEPADAVRGVLDTFGVPPERIPVGLEAQSALYRSLLAGKRVLIVLDNARDADHVRPLLPGAPECLVLVTSRNQLPGLVAAEGAHPLTLDLLTATEARELLAHRIGPGRMAAEPQAVDDIIASCARLPLALTIVAARAATHPGFPLGVLAAELRDARGGLDAFAGGDPATDARAVFSWSYQRLSSEAARLFRLLGLHPGPDLTVLAAASLAGVPQRQVRQLLAELGRAHLLEERTPGRFAFHDLLRAYATELAHIHDTDDERHTAIHRILDHYLHTAHAAHRLLDPHRDPLALTPPQPGVATVDLSDQTQAMAWFATEHPVLLAVLDQAAHSGFDTHTWQLAWSLTDFFDRRGHWQDFAISQRAALDAAQRLADRRGQAHAHRGLARAATRLGRYDDADSHLRHALDLFGELGDQTGQAHTHLNLGGVLNQQGRHREALSHAQQALELYRAAGHRAGQADALNAVGWFHAQLGNHQQALVDCQQALDLLRELGDRYGQAETWDSLGYAHHHLGHHSQAVTCYQQALDLYREVGDRFGEADTLARLGDTHHAADDPHSARDAWQRAVTILDQLDHPDAGHVRAKLGELIVPTGDRADT
jgi:class 3 adenylate cyclase/tetratricopeptide (TPR) repeat protein